MVTHQMDVLGKLNHDCTVQVFCGPKWFFEWPDCQFHQCLLKGRGPLHWLIPAPSPCAMQLTKDQESGEGDEDRGRMLHQKKWWSRGGTLGVVWCWWFDCYWVNVLKNKWLWYTLWSLFFLNSLKTVRVDQRLIWCIAIFGPLPSNNVCSVIHEDSYAVLVSNERGDRKLENGTYRVSNHSVVSEIFEIKSRFPFF